jgi:hypothetical protein
MESLKSTVEEKYQELDSKRKSNSFEDLSKDMIRAAVQKAIFEREPLSRAADSRESLEKLTDKLVWNMPSTHIFGEIDTYVIRFEMGFWKLLKNYGISAKEQELKPDELYFYANFGKIDKPKHELRVLPDHPKLVEVTGRLIYLDQKRRKIGEKCGIRPYTSTFIVPGFDNWRAAIVFANYSHMWFKSDPSFMARFRNAPRYIRFGLTSFEAVKKIKPGELFQVENVFGDFAAEDVKGDLGKFKNLSYYAHKKDAKKHFKETGDYIKDLKGF